MTVTYSRVGIELWGSKTIGEYTPRQVENVRSKRRVSEWQLCERTKIKHSSYVVYILIWLPSLKCMLWIIFNILSFWE